MSQNFYTRAEQCWKKTQSLLCVGLDPEIEKIPQGMGVADFLKEIVIATASETCAFKPQFAHFAALGLEKELADLILFIKKSYPNHIVILDAKRGDISSTADKYATEAFVRYGADAVTLNPYLGFDSLTPFLKHSDRGSIVLVRTSNPGAKDFQDLDCGGEALFYKVARRLTQINENKNLCFVVGATYPEEMKKLRALCPDVPFLVPGIGAQGGDVKAVMNSGLTPLKTGLFISSSRAILYASKGKDFALAARRVAMETKKQIQQAL